MKKLLTLVLALVMVFAVAAPAMAMTDEALGTVANTNDAYSLEIALYQANVADFAPGATFVLPAVQGANRAYVANENVYFGIKLYQKENVEAEEKVPQMMKITSTYSCESAVVKQVLVDTDGKATTMETPLAVIKGNSDGVATTLYDKYTGEKANSKHVLNLKGETLYFFGTFVNGSKDFSVKVEIKPAFDLATNTTPLDLGDDMNVIKPDGNTYIVNNTKDKYFIAFITDGVGRVKEMRYGTGTAVPATTTNVVSTASSLEYDETYKDNTDGLITAWNIANVKVNATEQSYIDKVFNKLGFDIARQNTNAVKDKHFIAKLFGVHLEAEVKGAYYTAVVTIPDVTVVEPPKTGDASTVAGFVMIAAAIVATLGLAYNKVRA